MILQKRLRAPDDLPTQGFGESNGKTFVGRQAKNLSHRGDGAGAQLLGLYAAVELPDHSLIDTQFADDDGNMYKPDGPGATFAAGSFDEATFDKETNKSSGYEDVLALFAALQRKAERQGLTAGRRA